MPLKNLIRKIILKLCLYSYNYAKKRGKHACAFAGLMYYSGDGAVQDFKMLRNIHPGAVR